MSSAADEKRQAYYCSREWGLLKRAVHERSGGICERCGVNDAAAVHHKTYIRLFHEQYRKQTVRGIRECRCSSSQWKAGGGQPSGWYWQTQTWAQIFQACNEHERRDLGGERDAEGSW